LWCSLCFAKPLECFFFLFMQDYDIPPAQYADVLALAGDQVDSIPGIRGIGEKTALALLRQFGSLQGVLDNAEQVGGQMVWLWEPWLKYSRGDCGPESGVQARDGRVCAAGRLSLLFPALQGGVTQRGWLCITGGSAALTLPGAPAA
jgi:hypothetical protein